SERRRGAFRLRHDALRQLLELVPDVVAVLVRIGGGLGRGADSPSGCQCDGVKNSAYRHQGLRAKKRRTAHSRFAPQPPATPPSSSMVTRRFETSAHLQSELT